MADELGAGMGLDHLLVDLVRQRVRRERGKRAAEGRLAGQFARAVPAAEPPQGRPAGERLAQRRRRRELIHALGEEGLHEPHPRVRPRAVAAPRVTGGEAANVGQREQGSELHVECGERPELLLQHREELPLELHAERRERSHPACDPAVGAPFPLSTKKYLRLRGF
jgi:hypothetical protein